MPRAPYIREKFTRDLSFARQLAKEYFRRFPKDQYETQVESWRQDSISKYRVHDEAVARAGRAALMKFRNDRAYANLGSPDDAVDRNQGYL